MGVPLEFSWISKAHDPVEHRLISWEAISGLQNKGQIEFNEIPEDSSVDVSMSVDYKLPRILSIVFRSSDSILHSALSDFMWYQGESFERGGWQDWFDQ